MTYHWLSHHGLWTITPCFTNNYGKDTLYVQFFCALLFTFWSSFLYFKDFFNKIILPLAVVRGTCNSVPCYLSTATFHIQCTLVEYQTTKLIFSFMQLHVHGYLQLHVHCSFESTCISFLFLSFEKNDCHMIICTPSLTRDKKIF